LERKDQLSDKNRNIIGDKKPSFENA